MFVLQNRLPGQIAAHSSHQTASHTHVRRMQTSFSQQNESQQSLLVQARTCAAGNESFSVQFLRFAIFDEASGGATHQDVSQGIESDS